MKRTSRKLPKAQVLAAPVYVDGYYSEARRNLLVGGRTVVLFSCGATSAVAAQLALNKYRHRRPVEIIYTDPGTYDPERGQLGEHPDNKRFLRDCEHWLQHPIRTLRSSAYSSPDDVYRKTRYLVGVKGARCTVELKKRVRQEFVDDAGDIQVFGYDAGEPDRLLGFRLDNPEAVLEAPLIERGLTKQDCLSILDRAGIKPPITYKLGYDHANCIGCVKGALGYWNKIRKDFPEAFEMMAQLEEEIGAKINKDRRGGKLKRISLRELDPGVGCYEFEPKIECGLLCETVAEEIDDRET